MSCPPIKLCMDNGVMVAWLGHERLRQGLCEPPPKGRAVEVLSHLASQQSVARCLTSDHLAGRRSFCGNPASMAVGASRRPH